MRERLEPPRAKVVPKKLEIHGDVRIDNYYWLNERDNPEVIAYLEAENEYTDAVMAHTKDLENLLFEEIKGRIKQTDKTVPYKLDDYYYYTRSEDGKEYRIHCRKKGSLDGEEEIMLDVNVMARQDILPHTDGMGTGIHCALSYRRFERDFLGFSSV